MEGFMDAMAKQPVFTEDANGVFNKNGNDSKNSTIIALCSTTNKDTITIAGQKAKLLEDKKGKYIILYNYLNNSSMKAYYNNTQAFKKGIEQQLNGNSGWSLTEPKGTGNPVEIKLSSWLYNYEEDSKNYAISTQITLAKLTTEWFNAKSDKDRESIAHLLEAIKRNTDDDWIDRFTEQGLNNLFGGTLVGDTFRAGGFSEEELYENLDSLLIATESYMLSQIKNIKTTGSNNVRVFRVEGSINERIIIGKNGQVAIENSQKSLFLNFGDSERANEFLAKRLSQGMTDVSIKTFEVTKSVLDRISSEAVLESEASNFPNRPIRVDVTKAENQFGLRSEQIKMLEKEIIKNSGKVIKGKVK